MREGLSTPLENISEGRDDYLIINFLKYHIEEGVRGRPYLQKLLDNFFGRGRQTS